MLEIDTIDLKEMINRLEILINEYEEVKINLFNSLKDVCIDWQDSNSIEFDNNISLENNETNLILQSLIDRKEVLSYIYERYSNLGNNIKINLEKKASINDLISDCKDKLQSIIYEFDNIDNSFYFDEQTSIFLQKNTLINLLEKLKNYEKKVESVYTQIEEIESEVKRKISKLENIKINDFEYVLGEESKK